MRIIRLNLKKRSYNITVGSGLLAKSGSYLKKLNLGTDAYVITQQGIKDKYGKRLERSLRESGFGVKFRIVADTEKSKSIETAAAVIKNISSFDVRKRVFIVAFGGGVVGDLAGFVASIYKRGTPYIHIPTTLLAQVDSAIGGKTAIDLARGKNLVGAIYQPRLVLSDVDILKSLPAREMHAGLAEVIKYGIIKNKRLFVYIERNCKNIFNRRGHILEHIVACCSVIKAGIVSADEKEEKGLRTILNFGHTIGHAIEAACGYIKYNHGEAVSLGMLTACEISRRLNLVSRTECLRIEALLKKAGLPVKIKGVSLKDIIGAHYCDKKFIGEKNRFVLLEAIGKVRIQENVPLKAIEEAIDSRV